MPRNTGMFWVDRPTLGQVLGTSSAYRNYHPAPTASALDMVAGWRDDAAPSGSSGGPEGGAGALEDLRAILDNIGEGTSATGATLPGDARDRLEAAIDFYGRAEHATGAQVPQSAFNEEAAAGRANLGSDDLPLWAQAIALVDLPRAAVTSAVKEGLDLFSEDESEDSDASLGDLWNQTFDHYGAGDLLNDKGLSFGEVGPRVPGSDATLGEWGDRATGLAGDVALDPLTYLTLGVAPSVTKGARGASILLSELAETAAREGVEGAVRRVGVDIADNVVREAAEAQVRRLGVEGLQDAARRVRQRGVHAALDNDELALLGQRSGVFWSVPGTGRVGRGALNTGVRVTNRGRRLAGLAPIERYSYAPTALRIAERSSAMTAPLRAVGAARVGFNGTRAAEAMRGLVGGRMSGIKQVLASTTDNEAFQAAQRISVHDNRFRLQEKLMVEELEAQAHQIQRTARRKLGRNGGKLIQSALGGNVDAIEKINAKVPGFFDEIRAWDDATRARANAMAGEDFIAHRADHAYAVRPKELREYYNSIRKGRSGGGRGGRSAFDVEGFETKANIVEGGEFMGERLVASADHPTNLNPREQAQAIIEDRIQQFGSRAFNMFEDDWYKVYPTQVRNMARRARGRGIENALRGENILKDLYRPTKKSLSEVAHFERMRNQLDFLKTEVARKTRGVEALQDRVGAATRRADRAARRAAEAEADGSAVLAARARTNTPSRRAAVQREYAEVLEAQHADVGAKLYAVEQRELRVLTDSDMGAARKAADDSLANVHATSGRLRSLRTQRDIAHQKLVRAQAFAEGVEADAAEIVRLQRDMDELDEMIETLQSQVDEFGRTPSEIQVDLDAVRSKMEEYNAKVQRLDRTLQTIRLAEGSTKYEMKQAADSIRATLAENGLTIEDVERQLANGLQQIETGRRFHSALTAELAGANGTFVSDEVRLATDDLETLTQMRSEAVARAQELGDNALAAELARGLEATVKWSETGNLVPVFNGRETSWRHGGRFPMDVTRPPGTRNTRELDASLGQLHLTANPTVSEAFQDFTQQGIDEFGGGGRAAVAEFDVSAKNPLVYAGEDSFNATTMPRGTQGGRRVDVQGPGADDVQGSVGFKGHGDPRPDLVGSAHTMGRSTLHQDMLEPAIVQGDVGIDDLAYSTIDAARAIGLVIDTSDETLDTVRNLWADVLDDVAGGAELWESVGYRFAGTDFDFGMANRELRQGAVGEWNPMETMPLAQAEEQFGMAGLEPTPYMESTTSRAMAYHVGAYLDQSTKDAIGQSFRERLGAAGHDSILYSYDDGTFALIPLESGQLRFKGVAAESQGRVDNMVTDWHTRMNKVRNQVDAQVNAHRKAVDELGEAVVEANGDARQAWDFHKQNQARVRQIERRISREWDQIRGERSRLLFEEIDLRGRVDEAYETAARIENEDMLGNLEAYHQAIDDYEKADYLAKAEAAESRVLAVRLGAAADKAEADLMAAGQRALTVEKALTKLTDDFVPQMERIIEDGFAQLSLRSQGPEWAVNALTEVQRLYPKSGGARELVRAFDYATNLFKTYAVLTPGFNFRNFAGGVWNNWLAGIEQGSYRSYLRARHLFDKGGVDAIRRELGGDIADAFEQVERSGMFTGGQTSELTPFLGGSTHDRGIKGIFSGGHNFGLRSNVVTKANVNMMGHVENTLRGALAIDTILKGGSIDEAIDRVYKFHFDYDDLSAFEASVMRRVFPFYTWMRKNVVLQVEQALTHPQRFNRILRVKANVEAGEDQEPIVPGYFRDAMAMMLPWTDDGQRMYLMPDLPYQDLNTVTNPREILSSINPWIKVPLEMAAGRQFFSNIPFQGELQEAPETWAQIPGLMETLSLFGKAERGEDGQWFMRDYDSYAIEQFMPLFGKSRRLAPSEDRYQQRLVTTWLSTIFGIGIRTNTRENIESEIRQETESLNRLYEDLVNLGFVMRPSEIDDMEDMRRGAIEGRATFHGRGDPGLNGELEDIRQAVEGGAMTVSELYDTNPEAAEAIYG